MNDSHATVVTKYNISCSICVVYYRNLLVLLILCLQLVPAMVICTKLTYPTINVFSVTSCTVLCYCCLIINYLLHWSRFAYSHFAYSCFAYFRRKSGVSPTCKKLYIWTSKWCQTTSWSRLVFENVFRLCQSDILCYNWLCLYQEL